MSRGGAPVIARQTYRCAAWGCPNSGCINDEGEARPGLCWQHFRESDRRNWPRVTAEVRRDFAKLKNHDQPLPAEPTPAEMFDEETF